MASPSKPPLHEILSNQCYSGSDRGRSSGGARGIGRYPALRTRHPSCRRGHGWRARLRIVRPAPSRRGYSRSADAAEGRTPSGYPVMSSRRPKPRIIVMTTYETEDDVRRALQAGAKSYLVKGALPEQILETVRRVAAGEALVPSKIASVLTESLARPELSPRELQVLRRLAAGDSNKEIGQMLQITEHTVKVHVKSILVKLGAKGRTEAIAIAIKRGLIRTG